MKKFKIGDKVRIRKDLEIGKTYGKHIMLDGYMAQQRGEICTIIAVNPNSYLVEENPFYWNFKMIEPINTDKLIFRENATILIKDGKKYVAKCEAGDTYDREKGLLVALAKANGYKFKEIQKMLANAEIQGENKRVREVARHAKIGEYIKIKNERCSFGCYENGDILKVVSLFADIGVMVDRPHCVQIMHDEYVVLENYKPEVRH